MSNDGCGWRGRSGDGSADQVSRRDGRRAAPAVGHETRIAQIPKAEAAGAPPVPARVSSDTPARTSRTGSPPIPLLDLFDPPALPVAGPGNTQRAPTKDGPPAVQRTAIRNASNAIGDAAAIAEVGARGVEGAEVHERDSARRADLESRAAHEVPGSSFTGIALRGTKWPAISPELVGQHVQHAVAILDGPNESFLSIGDNGMPIVSVGPRYCEVDVVVGDATPDVATHTYKYGATRAHITVSEQARPEDLTRAIAHELAEIHALMADGGRNTNDRAALVKGSTSSDLTHHDLGRKAELQVLLYELDNQPSRQPEIASEMKKLIEHLGFDPATIEADPRAKRLLGKEIVKGIAQMGGRKRIRLPRSALEPRVQKPEGSRKEWSFSLYAKLPNGKSQMVMQAHVFVDGHGQPLSDPELAIDKRVAVDGTELRIDVEGINSLTDFVLDAVSRQFEQDFGHPPTELPGSLGDDNQAIFRRAYVSEIDKGVDPQTAASRAAAKTPFVAARARRGYIDIKVTPTGTTKVTIGDPPRVRTVPEKVRVIARKKP